MKTKDFYQA